MVSMRPIPRLIRPNPASRFQGDAGPSWGSRVRKATGSPKAATAQISQGEGHASQQAPKGHDPGRTKGHH